MTTFHVNNLINVCEHYAGSSWQEHVQGNIITTTKLIDNIIYLIG